ncbi:GIY-YIG nuclease family protein [Rhodoligotrophos defluvii]|uniref:GIY-YIG nuclease family protein n=1 Tax=Rhodoligotrophos defluvii TaxID=2561934 RepID=UPI0010C9630F|nr:GIY-YIG nuclease family protein [Rhodoligotrophos defluvii]
MPGGYVYILASSRNGTLYVGVTADLPARIGQHRRESGSQFTTRYKVSRLVFYETFDDIRIAIRREKALKRWPRAWKLALIERSNPQWRDLYDQLNY